jgi:hypothetical protein
VSNVFHSLPHVHNHLSCLRGDQAQSGQRMREPEGLPVFSFSTSRSTTTEDVAASSGSGHMPRYYHPVSVQEPQIIVRVL